jgi:hypothetical protein
MYFFDLEDYSTTNRSCFDADLKGGFGGGGIMHCGRTLYGSDFADTVATARETRFAFFKSVHDWFSASTISIGNSTNTLARDIYYNEYIPNIVEFQINTLKYQNHANTNNSKKKWISICQGKVAGVGTGCGTSTYEQLYAPNKATTPVDYNYWGPYSGATQYYIYSANSTTNIAGSVLYTIVHPQFYDWNDSYYYNHNNSLRKVMGSVKRLMQAIDNDTFEDII